jgi:hypothetical protein
MSRHTLRTLHRSYNSSTKLCCGGLKTNIFIKKVVTLNMPMAELDWSELDEMEHACVLKTSQYDDHPNEFWEESASDKSSIKLFNLTTANKDIHEQITSSELKEMEG